MLRRLLVLNAVLAIVSVAFAIGIVRTLLIKQSVPPPAPRQTSAAPQPAKVAEAAYPGPEAHAVIVAQNLFNPARSETATAAVAVAKPVLHGVVIDGAKSRAFLEDPTPPDPADRQAFLDDHFRAGDASERIRAAIERAIATATEPGASPGHPGDEGHDARSERPIAAGATRHVG